MADCGQFALLYQPEPDSYRQNSPPNQPSLPVSPPAKVSKAPIGRPKARPDLVSISTVVPLHIKDAMLAHRDATGEGLGIIIEKGVCAYLGLTPEA